MVLYVFGQWLPSSAREPPLIGSSIGAMPWRRCARGPNRGWLDNVLIVSPSQEFLRTLPRAKLPDRADFKFYGLDHDARVRAWLQAMREAQCLRDELAAFIERPDLSRLRAI